MMTDEELRATVKSCQGWIDAIGEPERELPEYVKERDMASELLQWRKLGLELIQVAPEETPLNCGGECEYGLDLQILSGKSKLILGR